MIVVGADGDFLFRGECKQNSIRKTHWILKHTRTENLVLFKIGQNIGQITKLMREEIPAKYRAGGKLVLINFVSDIVNLTASRQIGKVERDWFEEFII